MYDGLIEILEGVTPHHTDDDWERPWVLGKKIQNARQRCLNIAESERLLGYHDNHRIYREIAREFEYLAVWVMGQIYQFDSLPPAA